MKQMTNHILNTLKLRIALIGSLTLLCTIVFGQPLAKFTATPSTACAPVLVQFSDLSTGNPTQWKWDLGNGTISYLQNPSVTYFTPGQYTAKLVVKNSSGADSVIKTNYITVNAAPVVNFTSSNITGCNPLTVSFTDNITSGSGTVATWQWDFGDGSLSADRNPTHTYTVTGNYNVTLKVTNSNGCVGTMLKAGYIKVNGVEADFSREIPGSCTVPNVRFQNTSEGTGTLNYLWSFGDGTFSTIDNPSHRYLTGGHFSAKLVASNNFGCRDSIEKNVWIDAVVSAAFTANSTVSCKAPFEVHFTNQVLPGNSYFWDFGDSSSLVSSNPTHVYTDTGKYSVKLIVFNSNGCIDSVEQTDYIKINKPNLALSNLPDSGCIPFVKNFHTDNISADRVINYLWQFGDGSTSVNSSPTHTYQTSGYFNVSLITTSAGGCRDTVSVANAINVNTKPVANFKADIRNTCAITHVNFTDLSTGATSWEWHFGDGLMSFEQNPSHLFTDTGYMNVLLIAKNGGCTDTILLKKYVYIQPAIAKWQEYYNCTNPFSVYFRDISKGADSREWDFGDNSPHSIERNPTHIYSAPGRYNVTLKVFNNFTGCTHFYTRQAIVISLTPDFFASDTIACKGSSIRFKSSLDVNDVVRFIWDYGDGTTFSVRNNTVFHTYDKPGIYTVKLVIQTRTLVCKDSLIKQGYIRIDGPTANFSPITYAASVNNPVTFTDSTLSDGRNPLQSWNMDYGDGNSQILNTPAFSHEYNHPGLYFVKLTVKDSRGCIDSIALENPLAISETKATFRVADSFSCPGKTIQFLNQSSGNNLSYRWSFGDGTLSAEQEPEHIYQQEGNYSVKLVATNSYGHADSLTKLAYIAVHNPIASFTMSDSFRNCPPLIIQFTDASSNTLNRVWDFGDGTSSTLLNPSHFYTYPGDYFIKLTATGPGGCNSTMIKKISVKGPRGTLTYDPLNSCKPYQVNFVAHVFDAVSYVWDFNDGNTLNNTDTSLTHTFTNAGNYLPKLMLVDSIGCRIPITGTDTIHAITVTAKFSFADTIFCNNSTVSFTNLTSSNVFQNTYSWNFGDGTFSTEKNPVHEYTRAGNYYPILKVSTSLGCADSMVAAIPVRIGHAASASIAASANSGCAPLLVSVSGLLAEGNSDAVTWQWSFGNDHNSTLQNPPAQNYTVPGVYNITLTTTTATGCKNSMNKTIQVFATPAINATPDKIICKGNSIALQATGADNYNWAPADGLSCTACAQPAAAPLADTRYIVKAISGNGCTAFDSVFIKVKQPIKIKYSGTEPLCTGQSKRLVATGATTYSWWPAAGLSNAVVANPLARPDSTTTYRVIGTDDMGCFKDTGFVKVEVYQQPTVNAGEDKTVNAGHPIDLVPVVSGDVTEINWSPTSGIFRNTGGAITVKPVQTTEYKVQVKNAGGCMASDKVTVAVLCDGTNIFIPNTFSPNNSGTNDIFYPRGTGLFKIQTLRIFNRWGEAVFEKSNFNANDPSAGWNGTFKGKKMNADVYIYFIEIICNNTNVLSLNGNVALLQ